MKIRMGVGSDDPTDTDTVAFVLEGIEWYRGAEYLSVDVQASADRDAPTTLEELIKRAKFRAEYACREIPDSNFGIGVERGLVSDEGRVPAYTEVCIMFDGHDFYGPGVCQRPCETKVVIRDGEAVSEALRLAAEAAIFG